MNDVTQRSHHRQQSGHRRPRLLVGHFRGERWSTIDVLSDGTTGFWVSNGVLHHEKLPYPVNTAVLQETLPGTGTRTTRLTVNGYSVDNPAPPADGSALVTDHDTVSVTNSAGDEPHDAAAGVTGNTLDALALAATTAMVDDGQALTVPVTGTYVDTATVSVAAGVVAGIVLS